MDRGCCILLIIRIFCLFATSLFSPQNFHQHSVFFFNNFLSSYRFYANMFHSFLISNIRIYRANHSNVVVNLFTTLSICPFFFQISYNVCKWLYLLFFILCFLVQSIYLSMIVIIFNLYHLFMATASIRLTEFLSIRFISLRFESFSWKIINERVGHVTSALTAY